MGIDLWNGDGRVGAIGIGWDPDGEDLTPVWIPELTTGNDYYVVLTSLWDSQWRVQSGLFTIQGIDPPVTETRTAVESRRWMLYR